MNKKRLNTKQKILTGTVVLLGLLSLYVFQINSLTTLAYYTKNQQTSLAKIAEESTTLETLHRQHFGVSSLEQLAKNLRFEKIAKVTYISILEGSLAQNQQK